MKKKKAVIIGAVAAAVVVIAVIVVCALFVHTKPSYELDGKTLYSTDGKSTLTFSGDTFTISGENATSGKIALKKFHKQNMYAEDLYTVSDSDYVLLRVMGTVSGSDEAHQFFDVIFYDDEKMMKNYVEFVDNPDNYAYGESVEWQSLESEAAEIVQ